MYCHAAQLWHSITEYYTVSQYDVMMKFWSWAIWMLSVTDSFRNDPVKSQQQAKRTLPSHRLLSCNAQQLKLPFTLETNLPRFTFQSFSTLFCVDYCSKAKLFQTSAFLKKRRGSEEVLLNHGLNGVWVGKINKIQRRLDDCRSSP